MKAETLAALQDARAKRRAVALATIKDGSPRTLEFGVSDEQAWEVGLACGGKVRVFVERVE